MEINYELQKQIFEIIKNQLKEDNPPEVKITFDRLKKSGLDDIDINKLIGQCVSVELFEIISSGKPYNDERYVKNLKKLPKSPI